MKPSLVRREFVTSTFRDRYIESLGVNKYDKNNSEVFQRLFEEFTSEGIIRNESFSDHNFIIRNKDSYATFIFDLDIYSNLQTALRCWVLLKKSASISTAFLLSNFNKLKTAITLTNGFKESQLHVLERHLQNSSIRVSKVMCEVITEFLIFIDHPNYEVFAELCNPFIYRIVTVRKLPPYEDVLIFDDLIQRFQNDCTQDEKLKYYPIILWWRISKVIPMRPSEFCLIKRNCLSIIEGNKHFITIPREKRKPQNNCEIEVTNTLQINKEIYQLIENYLELTSAFTQTPYLLSYPVYLLFMHKNSASRKINPKKLELNQFSRLLLDFYNKIVKGKFQRHDLKRINPGDTRHFAFCNMMLQGFNMLSIARMGGHHSLHSQIHYHGHLDYFAESYVYTLAQTHRMKRMNFSTSDSIMGFKNLVAKGKLFTTDDFNEAFEVDHGYCTDHPSRCQVGDCRFCEHFFIPKEKLEESLDWLKDCSQTLAARLKEQIKLMIRISKDMFYNLQTLEYQASSQEQLFSAGNELRRVMDQKSMVDSLMEET